MDSECFGLVQVTVDAVTASRRWRLIESLLISWHKRSSHSFFCSVLWALEGLIQMSRLGLSPHSPLLLHLDQLWVGTDCCSLQKETPVRGQENQSISAPGSPASRDFIFYIFMYLLHYASIWMLILSREEGLRNHLNILGEAWCRNGPHEVFLPNTGMCRVEAHLGLSSFWEDEWMKRSRGYDGGPETFPKDDRWAEWWWSSPTPALEVEVGGDSYKVRMSYTVNLRPAFATGDPVSENKRNSQLHVNNEDMFPIIAGRKRVKCYKLWLYTFGARARQGTQSGLG